MKTQIHITNSGLTIEMAGMLITVEAKGAEVIYSKETIDDVIKEIPAPVREAERPGTVHRTESIPPPPPKKTAAGYELTCEQCGKEFIAIRKKKYCSKSCGQKVYNKNYNDKKKKPEKKKNWDPSINPLTGRRD